MIASIIVLAGTMAIYCLSQEIKTIAGKSEFMFLLGMLLFHVCYPLIKHEVYGHMSLVLLFMLISLLMTYFWISILTFDIWWTFKWVECSWNINLQWNIRRNRQATTEDSRRFKFYCLFTFGTIAVDMTLFLLFRNYYRGHIEYVSLLMQLCYLAMAVADVILLVLTSVLVFRMSKSTRSTDHGWFETKKDRWVWSSSNRLTFYRLTFRYFAYLGIYFIMIVTWPVEIYSVGLFYSFESKIISDVIKLFSVCVIFVILAWKKSVALMKRSSIDYSPT